MYIRIIIVCILLTILTTYLWHIHEYQYFYWSLVGCFCVIMLSILTSKADSYIKGMLLILLGISLGMLLPNFMIPVPEFKGDALDDFNKNMWLFKNLVTYSCTGAGGSLIANLANGFLSKTDVEITKNSSPEMNKLTEQLMSTRAEMKQLKRYIFLALIIPSATSVIMFSIFLFH